MYKEKFFRVVEHTRTGFLGWRHHWTFVLIGAKGEELSMNREDLRQALKHRPDIGNQDVYTCMDRAVELFRQGRREWVGYPSGAVIADLRDYLGSLE